MIGYLLEKELRNHLGDTRVIATIVTMTGDLNDPAFAKPSKFIGPVYTDAEAHSLAIKNGWTWSRRTARTGGGWCRPRGR